MRLSDLIAISKINTQEKQTLEKLNQFIKSQESLSIDSILSVEQIYNLICELDLFTKKYSRSANNNYLITQLHNLIIQEIYPPTPEQKTIKSKKEQEIEERYDPYITLVDLFGLKNKSDILSLFELFRDIAKRNTPNRLQIFHILVFFKEKNLLDEHTQRTILSVFPQMSCSDAEGTCRSFIKIFYAKNYTKDIFDTILLNPYKKWGYEIGEEFNHLIKLNLLAEWQDLILKNPDSIDISLHISVLSKLTVWPSINKLINDRPEEAAEILEILYNDYKEEVAKVVCEEHPTLGYYDGQSLVLALMKKGVHQMILNEAQDEASHLRTQQLRNKCVKILKENLEILDEKARNVPEFNYLQEHVKKFAALFNTIYTDWRIAFAENNSYDKLLPVTIDLYRIKKSLELSKKLFFENLEKIILLFIKTHITDLMTQLDKFSNSLVIGQHILEILNAIIDVKCLLKLITQMRGGAVSDLALRLSTIISLSVMIFEKKLEDNNIKLELKTNPEPKLSKQGMFSNTDETESPDSKPLARFLKPF